MQGGLYAWIEHTTLGSRSNPKKIILGGENKKVRTLRMQGGLYAWIEHNLWFTQ
jgi:hypothetical protein